MSLWPSDVPSMADHSNRSADEYIDDALITDSVKKLLADPSDSNHFDLAADLLSHGTSVGHSGPNCGQLGAHSGATVQEGMDLVDALDTLVQKLHREAKAVPNDLPSEPTGLTPASIVFFDHCYCKMDLFIDTSVDPPLDQQSSSPPKPSVLTNNLSPVQSSFAQFNDNSYASSSTASATSPAPQTPGSPPVPQTPPTSIGKGGLQKTPPSASRRSQRQIDRIEKTVLEKIKAENQEMLKREKEEMESPIKRKISESLDDSKDETGLVIDTDRPTPRDSKSAANQSNKKRVKGTRTQSNEPVNKKSKVEAKPKPSPRAGDSLDSSEALPVTPKKETSELDESIADITDDDKTSGGRQQRNRRKPKRWDDDEVEVDFSGQLGILAEQKQRQEEEDEIKERVVENNKNPENDDKKTKANDSQLSSDEVDPDDDEDESDSNFGSEDDPDKLWCICRQPHDDRFMIGCDSCEEWFHGKCVNVTKQQGRLMEKAGQEWLCPTCVKGISQGVPRGELKRQADEKRTKLEAEERARAQVKRAAKEKFLKKEKAREMAKQKDRRNSDPKSLQKPSPKVLSAEQKASALAKKVSQMPPKKRELHLRQETEEKEKLKKLIKTSKKEFNKKRQLLHQKNKQRDSFERKTPGLEPISKVVPIVRKPEVKRKHKDAIDLSVQDLFKAEPMRKSSVPSTPTTPSTPGVAPFGRKPSTSDSRRTSTTGPAERLCPSGCGKTVRCETSVYCNQECIETHVNDCLKVLRTIRREKAESGVKIRDIDRRVVVVDKSTGRLLSGKDSIADTQVLEFIKTNQMFEILKPSTLRDKKRDDNSKTPTAPHSPIKSPKKDDRRSSTSRQRGNSESDSTDKIRENVKASLKETLLSRCKDASDLSINSDDIRKTANRIEDELFKFFNKETSVKYKNKFRSLIFNLKDVKNQGLFRKVVTGKISPERLVQMSAEELASSELAKWREREKTSMLEMIKRDAQDKANMIIVKKTHKGEEVIEAAKVDETPSEAKTDDVKTSETTAPNASNVSILEDLMGGSNVDTTAQHKTHLFSNNCRICMKTEVNKSEISKKSSTPSSTREEPSSRPTPKRVRVDPDSANKFLLEAAKYSSSSSAKRTTTTEDDDSREVPSSTVSLSSPEAPTSSSASRPVWKGTVFMQDVAKFAAHAVKVSGTVGDFLSQDISSQVTVIGRIAPEQVLDYVKKLRYSSRTSIGLVKFTSPKEERIGYDAFFDYLDSRKRYGVVGNTGKALKDFYILPLPKNGDIPDVLLPLDGPGLDKKSSRPNLLLGILIRSKGHVKSQTPQTSSNSSNSSLTKAKKSISMSNETEVRSYTPPPKTPSNDSLSPEDSKDATDVSYTPPQTSSSTASTVWEAPKPSNADDEPYDPEEVELSNSMPATTSSAPPSIEELMEQIAKSTNPVEMTSSVLSAIQSSSNVDLQRRLLDQLTAKVDEQKRQLEEQKAEAEANASLLKSSKTTVIPGLDGQFATSVSSLTNIQIPDNIHHILSNVKQKTREIEAQQERLRAVAEQGFKFDDPIVKNFGSKTGIQDIDASPEPEPMDLDEEVALKTSIIELNTGPVNQKSTEQTNPTPTPVQHKIVSDPRLRSKKQTPLSAKVQKSSSEPEVAAMTADELMQKAREQMAALAQMEANNEGTPAAVGVASGGVGPNTNTNSNNNSNNVNNKSQKIKIEWKKRK